VRSFASRSEMIAVMGSVPDRPIGWSGREAEIIELVSGGLADKQIAIRLGISLGTVKTHLRRLYRGERLPNRAAAVALWVQDRASKLTKWTAISEE
jgi:DNA-binding CsgD family transcriptional regulator